MIAATAAPREADPTDTPAAQLRIERAQANRPDRDVMPGHDAQPTGAAAKKGAGSQMKAGPALLVTTDGSSSTQIPHTRGDNRKALLLVALQRKGRGAA